MSPRKAAGRSPPSATKSPSSIEKGAESPEGLRTHVSNMFDLTYDGTQTIWHQNTLVGVSCLAFFVLGMPTFLVKGNYGLAALMLVTSVCSFLADYVHIEDPSHVAHAVDRVVAWVSVCGLGYASVFVLELRLAYCAFALVLAVTLFLLSRSSTHPKQWAFFHTMWHWIPLLLLFMPGMVGASGDAA